MPRWRWRVHGRGRPPKDRFIRVGLGRLFFAPLDDLGNPLSSPPIYLRPDEFEALRLVYLEGRTQEEAALWRALDSGRRKLVQALVERRPIVLTG